jgi:hypothetical protein
MSQESVPIIRTQRTETLGEQVRKIADQLKEERDLQIKVTSRILGAAAQIAENHDRLIGEVVDMVEEDLEQKNDAYPINIYTVETLKQQFKTLGEAKSHFGLKASSWAALVNKLNNSSVQNPTPTEHFRTSIPERLDTIGNEIKILRAQTSQILVLLQRLILDKE